MNRRSLPSSRRSVDVWHFTFDCFLLQANPQQARRLSRRQGTMPLAFPGEAIYPSYPPNSQNGGYYTNQGSEVGTPFSPAQPGPGPHDIVIDPALLSDSQLHQVHRILSSSSSMGGGGRGSSRPPPLVLDGPNVAFA